jgi:type I restriction enzyme R subunit
MTTGQLAETVAWVEPKVGFYIALKETIGKKSGDFIDLKSYEKDMRRLIDTYIRSEDSRQLGEFDDFTLLDFVEAQGEELGGKNKESAAEAIENNIRKKVVEKILINPRYYENMSAILDELIKQRREGAIAYEHLLEHYIDLVNKTENPNNNVRYPESIRHSGAMRAFYDNCGEDEELAIALHQAVLSSKEDHFRHNLFKEKRIKKALLAALDDVIDSHQEALNEVERIYNIVVEQGEY